MVIAGRRTRPPGAGRCRWTVSCGRPAGGDDAEPGGRGGADAPLAIADDIAAAGVNCRERKQPMEIFVANVPFDASEDDILRLFEAYGAVERVNIVKDRDTGRSRGFFFVGMRQDEDALAAIKALDGVELQGRSLSVSRARERRPGRRV